MWELNHEEGWALKNWCFPTVVLEKTLKGPLRSINQSILKEINPDYALEGLMLKLPPGAKSQLIGKDPVAGKDRGQEEKWVTENEMVGWHHWLNGHDFEQTPGDSEEQGILACCSPRGHKVGHDLVTKQQTQWCIK